MSGRGCGCRTSTSVGCRRGMRSVARATRCCCCTAASPPRRPGSRRCPALVAAGFRVYVPGAPRARAHSRRARPDHVLTIMADDTIAYLEQEVSGPRAPGRLERWRGGRPARSAAPRRLAAPAWCSSASTTTPGGKATGGVLDMLLQPSADDHRLPAHLPTTCLAGRARATSPLVYEKTHAHDPHRAGDRPRGPWPEVAGSGPGHARRPG